MTLLDGFSLETGPAPHEGAVRGRGCALSPGVQRLVAHVCLAERTARPAVAGLLWPDVLDEQALASLRSGLWRLRRAAPGLVEVSGEVLSLAGWVRVDVRELQAWARRATDPGSDVEDVALPDVALRGELLPGWYDDWVLLERERLRQLRLHALEVAAGRLAAARRYAEALEAAHLAVRAEPLRESAHRTLVRVHLAEGNPSEALRAHRLFAQLLRDELGVAPTERMAGLVRGLLPGRPGRVAC
ncbi:SARP family transcriptional regulator [Geodermatophilus marinus]|nr:SARP family transcriptional regulator [Geodermatophilus sp. LHW52908]